ncbi:MAG TPA: WGR domain-containing protein, partial [Polyangiaceae bacterium]|nr:WGR domain-containing protein [Polyangiaceae bacterium]
MRRFELSEGTSNKFWQVEREGASVTVCFGRIGTSGQTQVKTHASDAAAQTELDKLVKEKTKKGYQEVGGVAVSPSPAPAAPRAASPGAAKPPSPSAKKKPAAAPARGLEEGGLQGTGHRAGDIRRGHTSINLFHG